MKLPRSQFTFVGRGIRRRMSRRSLVFLWLTYLVAAPAWGAETPEVLNELDREQVYVGESVNYRVLLNHCSMDAEPDMSAFTAFHVKLVGKTQIRQSSLIDNGRERRQHVRLGPLYEYELTPNTSGRLTVPAPSVTVGGKTYVGSSMTLDVAAVEDQDLVYLSVTTDPESVYPTQPFQIRLTLAVKGLPDPAVDTDPLQLRRTLPSLTIPWAGDEQLDDALAPKEPFNRWLQQYIDESSYGVAINDYQQAGMSAFGIGGLDGFFGSRQRDPRLAFRSPPRRVLREDGRGRMVEYWEYVFARTVIPQRAGKIDLGTIRLKGQFAARINTRGNVELDPVYAIAPPPDLIVKEPPMEGRPASYNGLIGSFVGGAELAPVEASVGDPMTLTVWVRGTGTLNETLPPNLAADPTIATQFKVYDATEKSEEDTRRFTYSLRPKTAAATQFPSIPIVTYFDVKQERYVTLESDPIPIVIAAANHLAGSEIAMVSGAAGNGGGIGTLADGIFANVTDLSQLRDDGVHPRRWFLTLGALAGLFVIMAFGTQRLQRAREDTSWQRRRTALGRAQRRLATASSGKTREVATGTSSALVGLVADVCDLSEEGLTSADAASELAARNVSPALVARLRDILEKCDAVNYGSEGSEPGELHAHAQAVFQALAQELRSRRLIA